MHTCTWYINLFKLPEIINEYYHNNRYPTILCVVYITVIPSFVHISPTTSLVVYTNPPTHPQHDGVTDLHAHEYIAVHTRGQHPFSPLRISLSYIFMCFVGALNVLFSDCLFGLGYTISSTEPAFLLVSTKHANSGQTRFLQYAHSLRSQ